MPAKLHPASMTKDQQYAAVKAAKTTAELDALWDAWKQVGHSQEGLLYGALLARRADLGGTLGGADQKRVEAAKVNRTRGATLPPVTGRREAP